MKEFRRMTHDELVALRATCRGRSGPHDGETAITWDHDARHVLVYSTRPATIADVIDRCAPAVAGVHGNIEDGITLKVSMTLDTGRKVFRGASGIFAPCEHGRTDKHTFGGTT